MKIRDRRRGVASCLLVVALICACMIGGFYFILRSPAEEEKGPSKKPLVKKFSHDISGVWIAKAVKTNPPPGRRGNYKPSFMKNNLGDFSGKVEIGNDFQIRQLEWVDVSIGVLNKKIEWKSPNQWKFSMQRKMGGSNEERGSSERDKNRLKLHYIGANGSVKEARFVFDQMPAVPEKYNFDGRFREGDSPGEIAAEVMLYAPRIKKQKLKNGSFFIQLNPSCLEFEVSKFWSRDKKIQHELDKIFGMEKVGFGRIKKARLHGLKDVAIEKLALGGYPANLGLAFKRVDVSFIYGQHKKDPDRVALEYDDRETELIIDNSHSDAIKASVVFFAGGKGKLFTHNAELEWDLIRGQ